MTACCILGRQAAGGQVAHFGRDRAVRLEVGVGKDCHPGGTRRDREWAEPGVPVDEPLAGGRSARICSICLAHGV
jgi:hypothetical protein